MRELYELQVGTYFKIESKDHLEYIKSLMGDEFRFFQDSENHCLSDEKYLNVFSDFELASDNKPDDNFEQVSMPIPEGWNKEQKNHRPKQDLVKKPNHYQLLPEYEVKDVNKALLDKIEESDFDLSLYEAGWYQQSMQYFMRFYAKNGLEDLEKGIETMQFVVDSIKAKQNKA